MWIQKVIAWFRSLGEKKPTPKPVDQVVIVPPQPTPQPQPQPPEPQPQPQPPEPQPQPQPSEPTPTPPTPPRPEILPNSLHVFCEASGPLTFFAKATGRAAKEVYYHAIYGTAPDSGRTFRLIHPFYDPCKNPFDLPSYVRQAKAEGCCGISVDPEAWIPQQGPQWFRALSAECRKCGLMLAVVPKIKLEHLVIWWKMSAEDVGKVISETCDIDLEWQYLTTGDEYAASFESDTVTIQQIGLVDGTGDRWKPAAVRRGWIAQMRKRGLSVGIFLPKDTELASACRSSDYKLTMPQKFKRYWNVGDEKVV